MPDFPRGGSLAPKACISAFGHMTCPHWDYNDLINNVLTAGAVWPTANKALYLAFYLEFPVLAQKMGVQVTVQNGNLDVGIYDAKGNRLVSSGSVAVAVAGLQVVDITDTVLNPGTYFMAMACSSATAAFTRASVTSGYSPACGIQEQTTAFVLPATATFANPNQGYFPNLVIQCSAVL